MVTNDVDIKCMIELNLNISLSMLHGEESSKYSNDQIKWEKMMKMKKMKKEQNKKKCSGFIGI